MNPHGIRLLNNIYEVDKLLRDVALALRYYPDFLYEELLTRIAVLLGEESE